MPASAPRSWSASSWCYTPGISDSDPSIVSTTIPYIEQEAGYVVLVTPVSRCNIDVHFDSILRMCIRLGKMEGVIACSRFCDQVDQPTKAHLSAADREALEAAEDGLVALEAQRAILTSRQSELLRLATYDELPTVHRKLQALPEKVRDAEPSVKRTEVNICNRKMASIM